MCVVIKLWLSCTIATDNSGRKKDTVRNTAITTVLSSLF